jgi:FAD/FMN-containing dehydrogenase
VNRFIERAAALRGDWQPAARDHEGVRKDSSGYALSQYFESGDLVDLIVGSEGTLAIIVGVELRLAALPAATSSVLAAFGSLESAARGAELVREAGAAACELLDRTFLDFAAASAQPGARWNELAHEGRFAAVLIAEVEADDARSCEAAALRLWTAFETAGAETVEIALTAASEKEIWDLRHAASPILSQLTTAASMQFIEDGAVPPARLHDYVRGVRAALERRSTRGVIFGHAGDANVHVNPLIDLARPDWRDTVTALLEDIVALTHDLGGTLTGEHGDGRLRTPLMSRVWSAAAMKVFAEVKRCFDPATTFNPGVKVPLDGQVSIDRIKYDPALPPLPASARAALDGVVARRAYSDFRLSLIR